ncbi:MAG: hypothetical protein E7282_05625 [Lachnospiraceae bacterium]|nr:hypothetical protein [Lachnospiraceae bacterium]
MKDSLWILIEVLPVMLINSIKDMKSKNIYLILTIVWGLVGLLLKIHAALQSDGFVLFDWCGISIGLLAIGISCITKGQIGIGDGLVMIGLSLYFDLGEMIMVVFVAGMLSAITALCLMTFFRKKGKKEIPFVPFLTFGTMVTLAGRIL